MSTFSSFLKNVTLSSEVTEPICRVPSIQLFCTPMYIQLIYLCRITVRFNFIFNTNAYSNDIVEKPTVIYSTNYKRTLKTVEPLAKKNNLELVFYSPSDIDYDGFIKSNIGKTTLVVGHSDTIPDFVNELIDNDYYPQIDDLNNSNLYIVSVCGSTVTHKLIKVD